MKIFLNNRMEYHRMYSQVMNKFYRIQKNGENHWLSKERSLSIENIDLFRSLSSSPSKIPWHVLFKTQQQNPYRSQSTLGWHPLGSMFNHSCLPNCMWYLIGDYLFIYVC